MEQFQYVRATHFDQGRKLVAFKLARVSLAHNARAFPPSEKPSSSAESAAVEMPIASSGSIFSISKRGNASGMNRPPSGAMP